MRRSSHYRSCIDRSLSYDQRHSNEQSSGRRNGDSRRKTFRKSSETSEDEFKERRHHAYNSKKKISRERTHQHRIRRTPNRDDSRDRSISRHRYDSQSPSSEECRSREYNVERSRRYRRDGRNPCNGESRSRNRTQKSNLKEMNSYERGIKESFLFTEIGAMNAIELYGLPIYRTHQDVFIRQNVGVYSISADGEFSNTAQKGRLLGHHLRFNKEQEPTKSQRICLRKEFEKQNSPIM